VPHVTQFDEVDITDLEAYRQAQKKAAEAQGVKLTPLVFIMKAVVAALQAYPRVNSSLGADGESIVLKKYFHIGVAVDTKDGLVVPVVRDVDQKNIFELAKELGELSVKARDGQLKSKDLQGGCFTISSLGGIGGTAFTPIVNVPEVAILGVSRSSMKPVYQDGAFVAKLMLPLSLSYDHRVIDGAVGARFITAISQGLCDIKTLGIKID
jgi:pyruvate dehydrogenase E2 component (dihydrolipoamide acetyltransferase)